MPASLARMSTPPSSLSASSWGSGSGEDLVRSDVSPDEVGLTFSNGGPVLEGGPAVVGPHQLEDSGSALDALHPQAWPELPGGKIGDELRNSSPERRVLPRRERREVAPKPIGLGEGRHACRSVVEGLDEGRRGFERRYATGLDVLGGLALTLLPLPGPEPGLGRVDELLRAKQDPVGRDLDLERVALLQVGGLTHVLRDGHLALRTDD